MATVTQIGPRLGIAPTCAALGLPRATYYRRRQPARAAPLRRPSPRALGGAERATVLEQLHTPRFVDLAPGEVYATLPDEGTYLCSERTMYRLLAAHAEVRERRDQLRHPVYAAPELLARRPNALPRLLSLVQHRAPSLRPRPADACRRSPRQGGAARGGASDRARHGLRRASGTLPRRPTSPAGASRGSVDQPTQDPSDRGGAHSLNS